jgi:erythromycin esterase-like protein
MKAVLRYLDKVDPDAAKQAPERYACFNRYREDTQTYGLMTRLKLSKTCGEEVIDQLVDLQRRAADYARRDGRVAEDELFYATPASSRMRKRITARCFLRKCPRGIYATAI